MVLSLFGVTLNDLRVGGGLLLLVIALRLVVEGRISVPSNQEEEQAAYDAAVVPLISPLLIGPGAITAAVVLAAIHGVLMTSLAAIAAMLISLAVFLLTRFVYRFIGPGLTDLISRIMGVLIAALAISYIRYGVIGIVTSAKHCP